MQSPLDAVVQELPDSGASTGNIVTDRVLRQQTQRVVQARNLAKETEEQLQSLRDVLSDAGIESIALPTDSAARHVVETIEDTDQQFESVTRSLAVADPTVNKDDISSEEIVAAFESEVPSAIETLQEMRSNLASTIGRIYTN